MVVRAQIRRDAANRGAKGWWEGPPTSWGLWCLSDERQALDSTDGLSTAFLFRILQF